MSTAGLSLPCLIPSHGYPQMKIELSLTFQALPKLATAWTSGLSNTAELGRL